MRYIAHKSERYTTLANTKRKMNKLLNQKACLVLCMILLTCCNIETEWSCGPIATRITELEHIVGTFNSGLFSKEVSTNFEEAAILVEISDFIQEEECDEYIFEPVPQIISSISITSSDEVLSGGESFLANENLNSLFQISHQNQVYSIAEFINAQNQEPLIFYSDSESDGIVLQLLNQPDQYINQPFNILFSFTDSETLNIDVPIFEVSN